MIIILVFGVLFAILYASQLIRTDSTPKGFRTTPSLTEDEAINIAVSDLEKKVAPLHLDKYVVTQRYFGSSLILFFVHNNGTLYAIAEDNTIYLPCEGPGCQVGDGNDLFRGNLFYDVNGSWQDSSVRNCSPFVYTIDAESGEILWSRVSDSEDTRCDVKPPDW